MFNKNRDTMEVFNDRWKANHDIHSQVRDKQKQEKDFRDKMYGVYRGQEQSQTKVQGSMASQLDRINKNMSGLNRLNNNKW